MTATTVPDRQDSGPARAPLFLPELDVMRGAAIVGVLWLHVYFSGWPDSPEWQPWALRITHLFAHGAVPVFLFISGFLMARDRSPGFGAFIGRRARRVMIPGITWMTLALLWRAWRGDGFTRDLLESYALFDVAGQFYYLVVLAVLTVAWYPVIRRSTRFTIGLALVASVASLAMVAWYERQDLQGLFAVFAYRNPLVWAGFFATGLATARVWPDLRWPRALTLGAAAMMLMAGAVYVWMYADRGYTPASYFGVTVFTFSAASLFVWPGVARAALAPPFSARVLRAPVYGLARGAQRLAPYAFAIYLVHQPYFIGWFSDRVTSDTSLHQDYMQLMVGLFVAGTVETLLVVVGATRLWPWGARVLMGVEPTAPDARHDEEDARWKAPERRVRRPVS